MSHSKNDIASYNSTWSSLTCQDYQRFLVSESLEVTTVLPCCFAAESQSTASDLQTCTTSALYTHKQHHAIDIAKFHKSPRHIKLLQHPALHHYTHTKDTSSATSLCWKHFVMHKTNYSLHWYWHKGCNAAVITSLVMDEEKMKPVHWLGSVLCVSFSALTPLLRWYEGHLEQAEEEKWEREPGNPDSIGK